MLQGSARHTRDEHANPSLSFVLPLAVCSVSSHCRTASPLPHLCIIAAITAAVRCHTVQPTRLPLDTPQCFEQHHQRYLCCCCHSNHAVHHASRCSLPQYIERWQLRQSQSRSTTAVTQHIALRLLSIRLLPASSTSQRRQTTGSTW